MGLKSLLRPKKSKSKRGDGDDKDDGKMDGATPVTPAMASISPASAGSADAPPPPPPTAAAAAAAGGAPTTTAAAPAMAAPLSAGEGGAVPSSAARPITPILEDPLSARHRAPVDLDLSIPTDESDDAILLPAGAAVATEQEVEISYVPGSAASSGRPRLVLGAATRAPEGIEAARSWDEDDANQSDDDDDVGRELDRHVADIGRELDTSAEDSTGGGGGGGVGGVNLVDLDDTFDSTEGGSPAAATAAVAAAAAAASAAAAQRPPPGETADVRNRSILGVSGFAEIPAMDDWSKFLSMMTTPPAVAPTLDSVKRTLRFDSQTEYSSPEWLDIDGNNKRRSAEGGGAENDEQQEQRQGQAGVEEEGARSPTPTGGNGGPFDEKAELDPTFLDEEVAKAVAVGAAGAGAGAVAAVTPSPPRTAAAGTAAGTAGDDDSTTLFDGTTVEGSRGGGGGGATISTAAGGGGGTISTSGTSATPTTRGAAGATDDGSPPRAAHHPLLESGMGAARSLLAAFDCAGTGLKGVDGICGPIQMGTVRDRTMPKPLYDEEFTLRFLKEVTEEGIPLLLHQPPPDNDPQKDWTQKTVRIFIKPGNCRGSHLIQPKLSWARNNRLPPTRLDTSGGSSSESPESATDQKVRWTSLNLLDVHSILGSGSTEEDTSTQQRREKARAQEEDSRNDDSTTSESRDIDSKTCFFTVTSGRGDVYVFEAMTSEERDRVANGLRSVISRLTYNLITGNMAASTELVKNDDDEAGLESGELPSLRTPTQAMNEITHAFLD